MGRSVDDDTWDLGQPPHGNEVYVVAVNEETNASREVRPVVSVHVDVHFYTIKGGLPLKIRHCPKRLLHESTRGSRQFLVVGKC